MYSALVYTIIPAKLDRLFRDALDALEKLKDLKTKGVSLILVDMGLTPVTDNGVAKMFFTMLAGFAELERDRIRTRTADGRKCKRDKGGHIGGTAPFGYEIVGMGK